MTTDVRIRVQHTVARLTGSVAPDLSPAPVAASSLFEPLRVPRDAVHRLDSPASIARLRQHGLMITPRQCALFHALQTQ